VQSIPLPNPVASFRTPPVLQPNPLVSSGGQPTRSPQPARAPLTMPLPNPLGSAYREPPSDRCSCPPKQKRRPSKPRTVCYSGGYRERARGIDKQPRRKIPCL
jgi:hypothetical protein